MSEPTYVISDGPEGESILCLQCGMRSYNKGDIEYRYCGHCNAFHEEGMLCGWCQEPIAAGDKLAPFSGPTRMHFECGLRSVVGGLNHLNGECLCCGGKLMPDPEDFTRREAARMAAQAWLTRQKK